MHKRVLAMSPSARAEQLRDEGIQRSLFAQDRRAPGWGDEAFRILERYVRYGLKTPEETFTSEDVRRVAAGSGLVDAKEGRAWGAVFQKAVRVGLIAQAGFTTSKNPAAHLRPIRLWKRLL